jgi:hypothetical protein
MWAPVHSFARDAENHRATLQAKGRDRSGNGTANVTVSTSLTPQGNGTDVEVVTDLAITGRAAQFGSGVITEVSDRLLGEFVDRLSEQLGRRTGPEGTPGGAEGSVASSQGSTADARWAQSADTLDFGKLVGPALAKRFAPPVAATLLVVGVFLWSRRRHTA